MALLFQFRIAGSTQKIVIFFGWLEVSEGG